MGTECRTNEVQFQGQGARQVVGAFDGGTVSSDGGALLLRELEAKRRIVRRFAEECFVDHREPRRIEHTVETLCLQRVMGLCLGYEDLNDHDELRRDPLLALCCGETDLMGSERRRERDRGAVLAGKSTLQRFESTPLGQEGASEARYHRIECKPERVEEFFVKLAIEGHGAEEPSQIVLDFDPSDIELYGAQELSAYNSYYGHDCYLPMYVFWGKFILCALLRPSNLDVMTGLLDLLGSVIAVLRRRWPRVHILLRADSAFAREELMSWAEERKERGERIDYVFGLATNSRLQKEIEPLKRQALAHSQRRGGARRRFYTEFEYQTLESWSRPRRVISKVEHSAERVHQHFLVTSLPRRGNSALALYERHYCARGEAENRIKEQQLDLFGTRTSATTFHANQLRLWFSALAYALMNELRSRALPGTELAEAHASTIRTKLLKLGAVIRISIRRIRFSLPTSYPRQSLFFAALQKLQLLQPLPLLC